MTNPVDREKLLGQVETAISDLRIVVSDLVNEPEDMVLDSIGTLLRIKSALSGIEAEGVVISELSELHARLDCCKEDSIISDVRRTLKRAINALEAK